MGPDGRASRKFRAVLLSETQWVGVVVVDDSGGVPAVKWLLPAAPATARIDVVVLRAT